MASSSRGFLETLLRNKKVNAGISWFFVAFLALVITESILSGDPVWAVFTGSVLLLSVIPVLAFRDPMTILPWEVMVLASLPMLGRSFGSYELTTAVATYVSIAAVALIIAVELQAFTPVKMSETFSILFVVVTTMATAGFLAVIRWVLDFTLNTDLIPEEEALMWEFTSATAAGVIAGLLFTFYFRRFASLESRIPNYREDDETEIRSETEDRSNTGGGSA